MRALYLILIALLLQQTLSAQKRSPKDQQITSRYYQGKWFVKLNAASVFDPLTPTIQPSVEYRINKRVSGELILGIPIAGGNDSRNTDTTYLRYYKLKAELRLFPSNRFFYIGPQLFYTNKRQSKYDGIVLGQDGKDYQYRYAELRKNIFGVIIKAGRVFPLSEKWNLEGSFGLGPRFVNLKLNATNLDQTPNYIRILYWRSDKMGTTVALHVETTFKLSYAIF